jgi:transcriptional regulator with XRE-family HTH domain
MARATVSTKQDTDLGPRLRSLRDSRGLSLRALARAAGVTPGTLSQIENGRTSPSVSTLKTILAALGSSLGEFFSSAETSATANRFVFRAAELINIAPAPGLRFMGLPGVGAGRSLQCLHEIYAPGADTGPRPYNHPGEESGFCLAGTIEITVGEQREVLGPGDGYCYPSDRPHRWRNIGSVPAEVISACTPPTF